MDLQCNTLENIFSAIHKVQIQCPKGHVLKLDRRIFSPFYEDQPKLDHLNKLLSVSKGYRVKCTPTVTPV